MSSKIRHSASTLVLGIGLLYAAPTLAQETSQTTGEDTAQSGIGDIVVTAQRRSENLQETPLAISAFSNESLNDRQVTDVRGLTQLAPSVNIGTSLGIARISIRGISYDTLTQGGEARSAFHVDGVYVSRPPAQLAAFFDVDRVEVLRGPQGTLYGRNATAGAINVITGSPRDELSGYVRGTIGNYDLIRTEGAVNIPLGSGVAARFAFQTQDRDGYGKDPFTGADVETLQTRAMRGKLRFELAPQATLTLSGDYFRQNDRSGAYLYLGQGHENPTVRPAGLRFGGGVTTEPWDSASELSGNDREIYGFSGTLEWDLGGVTLNSLTGYRNSTVLLTTDVDGAAAPRVTEAYVREHSSQFSQELRLQGDLSFGNWLVGAYYFDESVDGYNAVPYDRIILGQPSQFSQGFFQGGKVDTNAYAVFGQADINLSDRLTLTLGARYSSEKKAVDEQFQLDSVRPYSPSNPVIPLRAQQASKRWSGFTPKIGLNYEFSDDIFGYLSYSQGFKSGGFNLGGVQAPFNQEKITAYEGGIRADLFDRHLRTNLSAFYYDYKDIQVTRLLNNISAAENAAAAELYGLEFEITAVPVENLEFNLSGSVIETRFNEYSSADAAQPSRGVINLAGNRLPQAPPYTVNAGIQYSVPMKDGTLTFRVDGSWVGKVYFSAFNRENVAQPAHSRFDAMVKFASVNDWTLTAFVKNISNEANLAYAVVGAGIFGFPVLGSYEPPRTFGLTAELKF